MRASKRDTISTKVQPLKPDEPLNLTEKELNSEITRVLTATNPHAPQNIVRYSFKERQYKPVQQIDQIAVHFSVEGNLLHIESDEAQRQLAMVASRSSEEATASEMLESESEVDETEEEEQTQDEEDDDDDNNKTEEVDENVDEAQDKEDTLEPGVAASKPAKVAAKEGKKSKKMKLVNQFTFCERASQTYNNPLRDRGTMTEPPPRTRFAGNANQWIIFDNYEIDFAKQQKGKEKKTTERKKCEPIKRRLTSSETQADELGKVKGGLKIAERMVNQNTFDEISQDFKYYEDESDEYREQMGTLLPLWKFSYDKAKKLAVTSIGWSDKYIDLLAIGFGSYEFMKQVPGIICFYTLKNPSYPEYVFNAESAVLSLDLHPTLAHMLCVGFYDGSVGVYSVVQKSKTALYLSNSKTGKHTDPVWQVRWQTDTLENNLTFFSISADGRITAWTLVKEGVGLCHECPRHLLFHDIIVLEGRGGRDEEASHGFGTTFDFHKTTPHLFLVGTEEGSVHKCTTTHSSHVLETIKAHYMAVYRILWNTFHPDIYMTCSTDWSVKIWNIHKREAQFVFDLGAPVGDIAWAPYSSTVFAAVSTEGKTFVYDLSVNKYEPICEQVVVSRKKAKLTHVAFNPKYPILVVGDDRGNVNALKLSPNLRKLPREKKGVDQLKGAPAEVAKLDAILALVG